MPVAKVKSTWTSGSLSFRQAGATDGQVQFGVDDTGLDVKFFGATSGSYMLWDESADSLILSGATFAPAGTTNFTGAVNFGVDGTGVDVTLYGDTASANIQWDMSDDRLEGNGAACVQIGESTTGVNSATPNAKIYGYYYGKTTAVTGTGYGIRGNAVIHVASAAGTAIGVFGRAANGKSTTDTDGVNLGTAIGGSFLVAGVGQSGPAVLSKGYGVYVQLDIDSANLTVSDARGVYVNVQTGNAAANTITACNLMYLEHECVVGTSPEINSAIKIAQVGGHTGMTQLIDAAGITLHKYGSNKQVVLMKFVGANGTTYYLIHDTDSAGTVAVATSVS